MGNNIKTVKLSMCIDTTDVEVLKKLEHHIENLLDLKEYPEIKSVYDVVVKEENIMFNNYSTKFHHGEIKDHFVLKHPDTNDMLLYKDDVNNTYPVIFFDPAKAEEFRRDNADVSTSVIYKTTGITFYDNGAVELIKK